MRFTDDQRGRLARKAKRIKFGRLKEIARNLTDSLDGFLVGYKYLIHDRAPCFTGEFREFLKGSGIKVSRLPRKSPNLNAFAERWVRTAKDLCVNQMIFFGEQSLRVALEETELFYNQERPHQGIGNRIIRPEIDSSDVEGEIRRRSRLGRTLNYYYREVA